MPHTTERPWGTFAVLRSDDGCWVKKIVVYPKKRLSLQSHQHRSEHWVIVKGEALATVGEDVIVCGPNSHIFVPRGTRHRIANTSARDDLVFVETQLGAELVEEDIVRYEDDFERA